MHATVSRQSIPSVMSDASPAEHGGVQLHSSRQNSTVSNSNGCGSSDVVMHATVNRQSPAMPKSEACPAKHGELQPASSRQNSTILNSKGDAADWLSKNARKSFVPVRCTKPSKTPKFEGERPGWVFKLGGAGLGYYRDVGYVHTVQLHHAVVPGGSTTPLKVVLDSTVTCGLSSKAATDQELRSGSGSGRRHGSTGAAADNQQQERHGQSTYVSTAPAGAAIPTGPSIPISTVATRDQPRHVLEKLSTTPPSPPPPSPPTPSPTPPTPPP